MTDLELARRAHDRALAGERILAPLVGIRDDERLTPDPLRALCRQLWIDPTEFGIPSKTPDDDDF